MSREYCDVCFEHKPLAVFVVGACEDCRGEDVPACENEDRARIRRLTLVTPRDVRAYHLLGRPERDRSDEEQAFLLAYLVDAEVKPHTDDGLPEYVAGKHVGDVGGRAELSVRVVSVIELEPGDFGRRFLCRMETEDGADVVWFTGENLALNEGDVVTVRATVKAHETYRGRKQTVVQRLNVVKKQEGAE